MPQFYDIAIRALNQVDGGIKGALGDFRKFGETASRLGNEAIGKALGTGKGGLSANGILGGTLQDAVQSIDMFVISGRAGLSALKGDWTAATDAVRSYGFGIGKLFGDAIDLAKDAYNTDFVRLLAGVGQTAPGANPSQIEDYAKQREEQRKAAEERSKLATDITAKVRAQSEDAGATTDFEKQRLAASRQLSETLDQILAAESKGVEVQHLKVLAVQTEQKIREQIADAEAAAAKAKQDAIDAAAEAMFKADDEARAAADRTVQLQRRQFIQEQDRKNEQEKNEAERRIRAGFDPGRASINSPWLRGGYRGDEVRESSRIQAQLLDALREIQKNTAKQVNETQQVQRAVRENGGVAA